MAKKDTSGAVAAMLSTAPRPGRDDESGPSRAGTTPVSPVPAPSPRPPAEPDLDDRGDVSDRADVARRARPGRPPRADTSSGAPRTLRLSQAVADNLRAAWLDEKRHGDDVLLSLQDFASQVIADGLRARGHD